MGWIGEFYHRRTNRQAEAIPYHRRSIELFERLVRENPEVRTYPLSLANGYCYLGQVLRQAGQEPEASDVSRKALALFERIDAEGLAKPYDLACIRSLSSDLVRSTGKDPAAAERSRRLADQAMEALRQSVNGGYRDLAWIEIDARPGPAAVARRLQGPDHRNQGQGRVVQETRGNGREPLTPSNLTPGCRAVSGKAES